MAEPNATPPFQRHRIYYLILKVVGVLAAIAIALRYADII